MKNLGGLRVSPYSCDFGAKWLGIDATVRITGRRGEVFETITPRAMTTDGDPAKEPPWLVPQAR